MAEAPHIVVCICTFKRAELLARLLGSLIAQKTENLFTYSIVVADNDIRRSAELAVNQFSTRTGIRITYCVEPRQNIALVRNCALEHADGAFVAFIDDDEIAPNTWLLFLLQAYITYKSDGVLGPVVPYFEHDPPSWVRKGKFFHRPSHPIGHSLSWTECRTGNVLFRKNIVDGVFHPFRPDFGTGGEDTDFFRRMIEKGCSFIWCSEATVYELVPPERCKPRFLLKRALLRGSNAPKHPANRLRNILRSVLAVPCYTLALPVFAIWGKHVFLKYLIKLCDHASRLLAFAGVRVMTERDN
jgi:succinoglycan biosynthesis protein ExoM